VSPEVSPLEKSELRCDLMAMNHTTNIFSCDVVSVDSKVKHILFLHVLSNLSKFTKSHPFQIFEQKMLFEGMFLKICTDL